MSWGPQRPPVHDLPGRRRLTRFACRSRFWPLILLVCVLSGCGPVAPAILPDAERLRAAEALLQREDSTGAATLAEEVIAAGDPGLQFKARVIAAKARLLAKQPDLAWAAIEPLFPKPSTTDGSAEDLLLQICLQTGWEWDWAEEVLRSRLQTHPEDRTTRDRLAYLYGQSARWLDAREQLLALISLGEANLSRQLLLCLEERMPPDLDWLKQAERFARARQKLESAGVQQARLTVAWRNAKAEECEALLSKLPAVTVNWPDRIDLTSRIACDLGVSGLSAGRVEASLVQDVSPPAGHAEPQMLNAMQVAELLALGRGLVQQQQGKIAIRVLSPLYDHDPGHREVCFLLGKALAQAGKAELSGSFLARARQLELYKNDVYAAFTTAGGAPLGEADLAALSQSARRLQLDSELVGWCLIGEQQFGPRDWTAQRPELTLEDALLRRGCRCTKPNWKQLPSLDPNRWPRISPKEAHEMFLAQRRGFESAISQAAKQPPVDLKSTTRTKPKDESASPPVPATVGPASTAKPVATAIQYREVAAECGVRFQFQSGQPWEEGLGRVYQFTGGGVGILDYDCDGWPDLWLTQAGTQIPPNAQSESDALFRNQQGERFIEVTKSAGTEERGYSQGVAVGDLDGDGFPDVYVANLGRNQLFQNQGDGTFRVLSGPWEKSEPRWSTSVLLTDLNGDGAGDLYDVNYLDLPTSVATQCRESGRILHACLPQQFPAAQDRLWINDGQGRFTDHSRDGGILRPDGKGLGVVCFRGPKDELPRLFIANDSTPNFLFVPQAKTSENMATVPLRYEEEALVSGLALDAQGRTQACMGVAAGDLNGDGRLDFCVTNFTEEYNTLYLQLADGAFVDETARSGLVEPTLPRLGFGVQCVDPDRDGDLDLLVANGHVDDHRPAGLDYRMPADFFLNLGAGRFQRLPASQVGDYFHRPRLGRGLATVDFDRDGRLDAVISHLDENVAVLRDDTPVSVGNGLSLRLIGVAGDRDGVGAVVVARIGTRSIMRQITAGDGYQTSQERRVHFGLGSSQRVDELTVSWLGGHMDRFENVDANQNLVLIQASVRLWRDVR